jgi:hypothetical protein
MHRVPALSVAIVAFTTASQAWAEPAPVPEGTTGAFQQARGADSMRRAGHTPVGPAKQRGVRASIGEGGNDLTARIGFDGRGRSL